MMFAAAFAAAAFAATTAATRVATAATTAATRVATAATAMTDRRMGMTDMTDRRMGMTDMTDRRMRMTGMTATGVSAAPMMPAVAAAPADARSEVLVAPVPAGAVPTVVVPAIIAAEPDELRALDHIQAVGRAAKRCGPTIGAAPAPMIDAPATNTVAAAMVTANRRMMTSRSLSEFLYYEQIAEQH